MSDYVPQHSTKADPEEPVFGDAPPEAKTLLSNNLHDKLKFVAQVLLPGVAALYFGLADFWGLPKAEEVVGSITALDAFLGLFLVASTRQYLNSDARFDGQIVVTPGGENEEGVLTSDLNVSLSPDAIANKKEILVKVQK